MRCLGDSYTLVSVGGYACASIRGPSKTWVNLVGEEAGYLTSKQLCVFYFIEIAII